MVLPAGTILKDASGAVLKNTDGSVMVSDGTNDGCDCECGPPCYRQARICSDASPSADDTLSGDFMTCADSDSVGSLPWKDSSGRCVYFLPSDPTTTMMTGTLYHVAAVPPFPDCATCSAPPTGCFLCNGCCRSGSAFVQATWAFSNFTFTPTVGTPTPAQLADAQLFMTNLLNRTVVMVPSTVSIPVACGFLADGFIGVPGNNEYFYEVGQLPGPQWTTGRVRTSASPTDPTQGYYIVDFDSDGASVVNGTCCGTDSTDGPIPVTLINPGVFNFLYQAAPGASDTWQGICTAIGTVSIVVKDNTCCKCGEGDGSCDPTTNCKDAGSDTCPTSDSTGECNPFM